MTNLTILAKNMLMAWDDTINDKVYDYGNPNDGLGVEFIEMIIEVLSRPPKEPMGFIWPPIEQSPELHKAIKELIENEEMNTNPEYDEDSIRHEGEDIEAAKRAEERKYMGKFRRNTNQQPKKKKRK